MKNLTMSDSDFTRLENFMREKYGINLKGKKQLIVTRLSHHLQIRGFSSFSEFLNNFFEKNSPDDLEFIINKLTTNYTFFMREKQHFSYFEKTLLPALAKKHERERVLSIWSAGCSSGEEPYTLSMYIKEFFGAQSSLWDTRILATDISANALAKAKEGVYPLPNDMPNGWLQKHFVPAETPGMFSIAPHIRQNVIYRYFNLMEPISFKRKFDVIFCRNVMIYFDEPTREVLLRRFHDATVPGGYLFISHSESLRRNDFYKMVAPAIYRRD